MLAWLTAAPAQAAATAPVLLAPPASSLQYTVFAIGMLPVHAQFKRFTGSVAVEPGRPASCRVQVNVAVASLHMDDPDQNKIALGPTMLDAAHYPIMRFVGRCQGSRLVGQLTLHGVTRPLTMVVKRDGSHVAATGVVQRRDFGIRGLPGLVGPHVRFRLETDLPPAPKRGSL
jgi:polyisoprenoid-binding protein YceI